MRGSSLEKLASSCLGCYAPLVSPVLQDPVLNLVGTSKLMQDLRQKVQVAREASSVLILGENGTGKELVARAVGWSEGSRPFVAVNCGAIPETLIESELFGYEKGAFTGAYQARTGKFQHADGGVIFLDEIGELPMAMQVRLLRVLQERVVTKVGSAKEEKVNLRVVAATNRDLRKDVENGRFREDLLHRISCFVLHTPPLREHLEDLPAILEAMAGKQAADALTNAEVHHLLLRHEWPGNVRELSNVVERFRILQKDATKTIPECAAEALQMSHWMWSTSAIEMAPRTEASVPMTPGSMTPGPALMTALPNPVAEFQVQCLQEAMAELAMLRSRVTELERRLKE